MKAKLDELQTSMAEQEANIGVLRAELNKKHEQLGFITDEKVKQLLELFFYNTFRMQMEEILDLWGNSWNSDYLLWEFMHSIVMYYLIEYAGGGWRITGSQPVRMSAASRFNSSKIFFAQLQTAELPHCPPH